MRVTCQKSPKDLTMNLLKRFGIHSRICQASYKILLIDFTKIPLGFWYNKKLSTISTLRDNCNDLWKKILLQRFHYKLLLGFLQESRYFCWDFSQNFCQCSSRNTSSDFIRIRSDLSQRFFPSIPPVGPPEVFLGIPSETPAGIIPEVLAGFHAELFQRIFDGLPLGFFPSYSSQNCFEDLPWDSFRIPSSNSFKKKLFVEFLQKLFITFTSGVS